MDNVILGAAIILGLIGAVLSNCHTTPCLRDGSCTPNVKPGPPFTCQCDSGFDGMLCEKPTIREGLCLDVDAVDMIEALVSRGAQCQADCGLDSECPNAEEKCCLQLPCSMRCMPAENTGLTPCQQERLQMNRTAKAFMALSQNENINFQQYVAAVRGRPGYNAVLDNAFGSVSLTQVLEMFGSESIGTIFGHMIAVIPFPNPTCTSSGAYEDPQCTRFLSDSRQGACIPLYEKFNGCTKLPVAGDGSSYIDVKTGQVIQCPFIFDEASCACYSPVASSRSNCFVEVDLPFETEYGTRERRWWAWIQNYGVLIEPRTGATTGVCAYFDGSASLRIPRYSSSGWGTRVHIEIRYQEDLDAIGTMEPQALFSNAACERASLESPSVAITHKPPSQFGIQLDVGATRDYTASSTPGEWKTVIMSYDSGWGDLRVTLNGAAVPLARAPVGTIRHMICPVGIGVGNRLANFKGCIDYVRIYRCIPTARQAQ